MVSHFIKFGNLQGSSALLRAHGSGGASAIINMIAPQKNFRAKPKQAGKKEGGLGEGIFARLLTAPKARLGWERFRLSALAERQNRKIFFSLIEKNFGGVRLKKCRENVSVLLAVRRAETRGGIQSKSACGFSLKKVRISFRVRSHEIKSPLKRFYFMARYVYINGQVILLLFFNNL